MDAIVEAQRTVALNYFEDGSVDAACPPSAALLHIMAHGQYQGKTEMNQCIRAMFTHESLLQSDWYKQRLCAKQTVDITLWSRRCDALKAFLNGSLPAAKSIYPPASLLRANG